MFTIFISYFTLIICSFYIYAKLLNLKNSLKTIFLALIFSVIFSVCIYYIKLFCTPLDIPILMASSFLYISLTTKTEQGLSITTTIISFGIGFAFYVISSSLAAALFFFIGAANSNNNKILISICATLIQLILCCIPWRLRRLKSGMPFLRNKGGGNIGVMVSTILLCCFIVYSNANNPKSIFFIAPFIFIFLCGICILFWWRSRLQKTYIEKLRAAEVQSLRDAVQEKEKQIEQLEENNDYLAKIIHKDNKLIPAMELAVREYLQFFGQKDCTDIRQKGQMLLDQLKEISRERSGIIEDYQSTNEIIPQIGILPIDALMEYMFNKAKANGIKYDFTVSGSVRYLVENIIAVSDLRALLADLIENAIIATKDCGKKEILVSIGVCEGYYIVDVFDSGKPFEKEPLINFGRKKTTTHADTGGSGIGLMAVSEIVRRYRASFVIEEFPDQYNIFTKKVSVKFDHLNQYSVKARTDEIIRTIPVRKDSMVHI